MGLDYHVAIVPTEFSEIQPCQDLVCMHEDVIRPMLIDGME